MEKFHGVILQSKGTAFNLELVKRGPHVEYFLKIYLMQTNKLEKFEVKRDKKRQTNKGTLRSRREETNQREKKHF